MSIQIVHCGDIHLDRIFNYGDLSKSAQRRRDVENNFAKAIDFALKENSDIFLISGDVFDRVNPSNAARVFLTTQIKRLRDKNIPVFLIGGNHDVPKIGSQSLAIDSLQSAGLATVFSDSYNFQEKKLIINQQRIQVVGKSYFVKNQELNPFNNYKIKKESKYLICLLHGSLVGLNVNPSNPHITPYNPFGLNDIDSSINYLALGHFHNYFQQKTNLIICNPGSLEKLNWSEANDEKGFVFVELNDENEDVQFIPLKTRKHSTIEITIDSDIENINEHILNRIKKIENKDEILRVKISGIITRNQLKTFSRSHLAQKSDDYFFHCDFDSDKLEFEGLEKVFLGKVDSPSHAFEKHLNDLIEKSKNQTQRDFIIKAKQRGLEYLGEVSC